MSKIKNIIFDLDGTLWDSRKQVIEAWKTVIPDLDVSLEELSKLMGKTTDEFIKFLFPDNNEDSITLMNKLEIAETEYLSKHGAILYNNCIETLKELHKDYNLFIVSNCQDNYIESFTHYYKIEDLFLDTECNGRTNLSKSKNIELIINRNNLNYEETCYIGDTNSDLESALDNNIIFILASYGFGNINSKYSINSLQELPELIKIL